MKYFLLLTTLISSFLLSQKNDNEFEYYEMTSKRVFINKNVTSYNFTVSKYANDIEVSKKEYINFKKPVPSRIIINTDENKSSIRINSKYYKEDLYFEFARVYKILNDDGSFFYDFVGKNPCSVFYSVPTNNYNQSLYIKCLDRNKNGTSIRFTMSQNEQL